MALEPSVRNAAWSNNRYTLWQVGIVFSLAAVIYVLLKVKISEENVLALLHLLHEHEVLGVLAGFAFLGAFLSRTSIVNQAAALVDSEPTPENLAAALALVSRIENRSYMGWGLFASLVALNAFATLLACALSHDITPFGATLEVSKAVYPAAFVALMPFPLFILRSPARTVVYRFGTTGRENIWNNSTLLGTMGTVRQHLEAFCSRASIHIERSKPSGCAW